MSKAASNFTDYPVQTNHTRPNATTYRITFFGMQKCRGSIRSRRLGPICCLHLQLHLRHLAFVTNHALLTTRRYFAIYFQVSMGFFSHGIKCQRHYVDYCGRSVTAVKIYPPESVYLFG